MWPRPYQRIQWNLETFSLQLRSPLTTSLDSRRTKEDLQWITMHKAAPILSICESFHTWHTSIILCKMVFRADRSWFHSHQATPEQMLCQWPPLEEVHDSSHYPIEFHKPFQICFLTTNLQQLSILCSIQSWDDAAYLQLETAGIAVSCGDICNNGERHVITRDWRFMIDVCVVNKVFTNITFTRTPTTNLVPRQCQKFQWVSTQHFTCTRCKPLQAIIYQRTPFSISCAENTKLDVKVDGTWIAKQMSVMSNILMTIMTS